MDNLLYNACVRYFTSLSNYGYQNETEVKKLLFYVFIQELVNTTSVVISEEDYKDLEKALYCIYGTSCLIPYPEYCNNPMYAHFGDVAELSKRVEANEEAIEEIRSSASPESALGVLVRVDALEDKVSDIENLDMVLEGPETTPTT